MKGGKTKTGYTIVEVMIVLAISSMMFLASNAFISGKVSESSFRTGVNETASRIQDTINQVSSGQYSDQPFDCSIDGGSGNLIFSTASGDNQGKNTNCVYIGKYIQFNTDSTYTVSSLAAKKVDGDISDLNDIRPSVIEGGELTVTTTNRMPNGVSSDSEIGFGFIISPTGQSSPGTDSTQNIWFIEKNPSGSFQVASGSKNVCLKLGDRSAKIYINENNNLTSIRTNFLETC